MESSSPTPCHVFTPEWIAELKERWAGRPNFEQPSSSTSLPPRTANPDVTSSSVWVDALAPEERCRIVPKLRDLNQFDDMCNELAVGQSFRAMGHRLTYEPDINGQTPDWLVEASDGTQRFIAEVVSSNPPDQREKCDEGWDRLRRRIETMPGDAYLMLAPPFPPPAEIDEEELVGHAPNSDEQTRIVRQVQQWLETNPDEGKVVTIEGIDFHLLSRLPDCTTVSCGIHQLPYMVDGGPLRKSVKGKASKYRKVVEATKLPLVVCVVPDFNSGRGIGELKDAVLGDLHLRLLGRDSQGKMQESYFRGKNGLFRQYENLTAVTNAKWSGDELIHMVILNDAATYKLAQGAFLDPSKVWCPKVAS